MPRPFASCNDAITARGSAVDQESCLAQILQRLESQDRRQEQVAKQQLEQQADHYAALCEKLARIHSACVAKNTEEIHLALSSPSLEQPGKDAAPAAPVPIKVKKKQFLEEMGSSSHRSLFISEPTSNLQQIDGTVNRLREILTNWRFDAFVGAVILLNMCFMFAQLQWAGCEAEYKLGLREDDGQWQEADSTFELVEKVFNAFYLIEVLLRVSLLWKTHFKDILNTIDSFVVICCVIEDFILKPLNVIQLPQLVYLRAVRTVRVFRTIKVLKFMKRFSNLRVLLKVLASTLDDLMWGMLLLASIIVCSGMLLVTLVQPFIEDENLEYASRKWAFQRFGSSFRACYSLFEATFTGTWTQSARELIFDINELFVFFWVPYVCIVNFAICKVVGALFLKQTMAVASADAETHAAEILKRKKMFAANLHNIFSLADKSGDGCLSQGEFKNMLHNPEVLHKFEQLDLPIEDVSTLFLVLSDEDGTADYAEFLSGAMRMKGEAQHLDAITITHAIEGIHKHLDQIFQRRV